MLDGMEGNIRDVLLRESVRGRRQSLSSATLAGGGGPISPRERRLPKRLPGRSPSGGPLGLNLLPICQVSSVSAGPTGAGSREPGPRRLKPPSDSDGGGRTGAREDARQSEAPSDTEAAGGSRGPSKRRRDPSREGKSGRGPSLRQLPANLGSSSNEPPPKPERSFGGSATLTRTARPARVYHIQSAGSVGLLLRYALTLPVLVSASLRPSTSANST